MPVNPLRTLALLLLTAAGVAQFLEPATARPMPQEPGVELARLAEDWVQRRDVERIDDVSFSAAELEADYGRALVDRLDRLDRTALTHQDDLTWAVLRWQALALTDELDLYWFHSPLMPAGSPMRGVMSRLPLMPLDDEAQTAAYLEYLKELARVFDDVLVKAMGRAERGIVLPDEQIDRLLPYWRAFAANAALNPLIPPARRYGHLPAEIASEFGAELATVIENELAPRANRIVSLMESTLRGAAPNAVGMGQYPGGKRAYRLATRLMTTLEITPEEVHEIGLAAVEDINRQMAEVRAQLGFTATKAEFHQQLRDDPRFYVDTPDEFGAALLAYDAKIRPHIFDYFLREPEAPYSVRRVSSALEASLTYGFYNPPSERDPSGYYNYNGSKLSERSLLSGAGLTYHELVPGHHYQVNLALENEDLSQFRRETYFSGYGEGWSEYASSVVAREMGMYEDPYDLYGRLLSDMFFAVRLAVDTGMNHYGWSRPRAMLFMRDHTLESDTQIDSETIRYSMRSPAQALAYRMGRDTWLRLRRHAQAELGDAFNVRRFHEAVLTTGALPMVVLEDHVAWWIEKERNGLD